jgi:hypothetical protein
VSIKKRPQDASPHIPRPLIERVNTILLLRFTELDVHRKRVLEHFNIFCSALCRQEDTAGKEEYAEILVYCESF